MYNNFNDYATGGSNNPFVYPNYNPRPAYGGSYNYPLTTPYPPGGYGQTNLPTIQTKMIQVENKSVVDNFAVGIGETVTFITKDDKQIFFKTGLADGTTQITTYTKEEEKPAEAPNKDFITREEFNKVIGTWQDSLNELKSKNNINPGKGKSGGNS